MPFTVTPNLGDEFIHTGLDVERLHVGSQLDMEAVYQREGDAPLRALQAGHTADGAAAPDAGEDSEHIRSTLSGVVWTPSMRRMYTLVKKCDTLPPPPYCQAIFSCMMS